jgi:hypothetical protein
MCREWFPVFQSSVVCVLTMVKQSRNKKALHSFKTLGTTHQLTQHHITADLNPQQHCCESMKFHKSKFVPNYISSKILEFSGTVTVSNLVKEE